MIEAYRRQILADMGIPSWRLRVAPGAQAPSVPAPPAARPAPGGAGASPAGADVAAAARPARTDADPRRARAADAAARAARAVTHHARETAADAGGEPAADARAARSDTSGEADVPWAVLSLVQGHVVLFVDGDCSRRDLRLARDILAAATGDWRGKPVRRLFQWPPALAGQGIAPTADAGRRALGAFLDKDLADHEARLLLCAAPAAQRIDSTRAGCPVIALPSLQELGANPDAKQTLWQALAESRR